MKLKIKKRKEKRLKRRLKEINDLDMMKNCPSPEDLNEFRQGTPEYYANIEKEGRK